MNKLILLFLGVILISSVSSLNLTIFPDIQHYTRDNSTKLFEMINYSINKGDLVLFVGDLVQDSVQTQWDVINQSLGNLSENNITYLIGWGNHDLIDFNVSDYQEPVKYLLTNESIGIITLPYNASDSEINQTNEILTNNSNYSFILLTHDFSNYTGIQDEFNYSNRLNFSNIFMVISGHWLGNNIFIRNNLISILAGHNTDNQYSPVDEMDETLTDININNLNDIDVKTYSLTLNKTIYLSKIQNNSINYSIYTQIVIPEPKPVPVIVHSGGGGGGSSSPSIYKINKTIQNQTNKTLIIPEINKSIENKTIEIKEIKKDKNLLERIYDFIFNLFTETKNTISEPKYTMKS